MFHPNRKIDFASGAIKSDTGKASGDARVTTVQATLAGCKYQNTYVTEPTDGWDSLLVSAA